jgi:hypothetical protein
MEGDLLVVLHVPMQNDRCDVLASSSFTSITLRIEDDGVPVDPST